MLSPFVYILYTWLTLLVFNKIITYQKKNPSSTPPHLFDQLMLSELLLAFLIDLFVID